MQSAPRAFLALPLFTFSSLLTAHLGAQSGAQAGDGPTPGALPAKPASVLGSAPGEGRLTAPQPVISDWHVPIHSQVADPVGGAYGTWAAELTFKASFHDGFAFYPFLGADYAHNLPVRWTTESVTAGGEPHVDCTRAPVHANTASRYEYRFDGLTEAYDVRANGVEQSFVLARRPTHAGDLVITGRVATELTAAAVAAARQSLVFRDADGNDLVSYGEAIAIDAGGQRFDVLTAYDGTHIRLIVPAATVAAAAFPLVVDPLLARVTIATWGAATFGLASYPEVGRDDESTASNVMTFYSRQFSATDFDGYARLTNDDFSNTALVYTDVTTSWSTVRAGTAFVGAADRWVLCLQRNFTTTTTTRVRVVFHDKGNTTLNSGLLVFHDPGAECNWYPAVGGTNGFSASGVNALLVYQADVSPTITNTTTSQVYAVLCNASTRTIGTRVELDNGVVAGDNEYPDVNQESNGGTSSWVVAFEQFNNSITNDDVDVILSRVTSTGTIAGYLFAGPATGSPTHKLQPQVSGRNGRYAVSMVRSNTRTSNGGGFGSEILIERFDWSEAATTPTKFGPNTLVSNAPADFVNGGLAHDDNSSSHWALVYQRGGYTTANCYVLRVGFTGSQTEIATLYSGPNGAYSPAIAFNDDLDEFQCVYASTDNPPTGQNVYGHRFLYPSAAINVAYGSGCGPGTIFAANPYAGSEFFNVGLGGVPTGTLAVLIASGGPALIPLDFLGMTGCTNLIDLGVQFGSIVVLTPTRAGFVLPDNPLFLGDVYVQWAYFDAGLNPAGLGATSALRIQVR